VLVGRIKLDIGVRAMTRDIQFPDSLPMAVREYWDDPDTFWISETTRENFQRLIEHESMREIYKRLATTFRDELDALGSDKTDIQVKSHIGSRTVTFLECALHTNFDFEPYRNNKKNAPSLLEEISLTAKKLASLLQRLDKMRAPMWVYVPSVHQLLKNTDNPRRESWRLLRHHILGPPENATSDEYNEDQNDQSEIEIGRLRHAWNTAPALSYLLETLAIHSRQEIERPYPTDTMIGAAISSQKHNRKTEYIRAFIRSLRDYDGIVMTKEVMHAAATAAEVVLDDPDITVTDDPDITVTYDDVRKLAMQLGIDPPETWPSDGSKRIT